MQSTAILHVWSLSCECKSTEGYGNDQRADVVLRLYCRSVLHILVGSQWTRQRAEQRYDKLFGIRRKFRGRTSKSIRCFVISCFYSLMSTLKKGLVVYVYFITFTYVSCLFKPLQHPSGYLLNEESAWLVSCNIMHNTMHNTVSLRYWCAISWQ